MSRDISKSIKSKLSPLNCPIIEYTIIMTRKKTNSKKEPLHLSIIIDKLTDLGWDYSCNRMSRSGMFFYDQIMTRLGILQNGEHWNEDVYQDHNCDH